MLKWIAINSSKSRVKIPRKHVIKLCLEPCQRFGIDAQLGPLFKPTKEWTQRVASKRRAQRANGAGISALLRQRAMGGNLVLPLNRKFAFISISFPTLALYARR